MKWPTQLVIVRHAQSEYNILREKKQQDQLYQDFVFEFETNHRSDTCRELAREVHQKYRLGTSDYHTRLTEEGELMAKRTGFSLRNLGQQLPHVVYVSPYLRTRQTFLCMQEEWPQLNSVKLVIEDRVREQEHGLSLLYNDWRVFHVMHPEQKDFRDLQGSYWYQYPQGESVSQVRDRIRSFLTTLVRENSGKRVMLVTHHLTLLSIRAILERLTPEQFIHLDENEKPVNCGVTIYDGLPEQGRDGKLVLSTYNQKFY